MTATGATCYSKQKQVIRISAAAGNLRLQELKTHTKTKGTLKQYPGPKETPKRTALHHSTPKRNLQKDCLPDEY